MKVMREDAGLVCVSFVRVCVIYPHLCESLCADACVCNSQICISISVLSCFFNNKTIAHFLCQYLDNNSDLYHVQIKSEREALEAERLAAEAERRKKEFADQVDKCGIYIHTKKYQKMWIRIHVYKSSMGG